MALAPLPTEQAVAVHMVCCACVTTATMRREDVPAFIAVHLRPSLVGVDVIDADGARVSWWIRKCDWPAIMSVGPIR